MYFCEVIIQTCKQAARIFTTIIFLIDNGWPDL